MGSTLFACHPHKVKTTPWAAVEEDLRRTPERDQLLHFAPEFTGHTNGESHEEGHEESHEENAGANQQATAEPAAIKTTDEPKLDDIVLLSSKGTEEATQADIDALFD